MCDAVSSNIVYYGTNCGAIINSKLLLQLAGMLVPPSEFRSHYFFDGLLIFVYQLERLQNSNQIQGFKLTSISRRQNIRSDYFFKGLFWGSNMRIISHVLLMKNCLKTWSVLVAIITFSWSNLPSAASQIMIENEPWAKIKIRFLTFEYCSSNVWLLEAQCKLNEGRKNIWLGHLNSKTSLLRSRLSASSERTSEEVLPYSLTAEHHHHQPLPEYNLRNLLISQEA